MYIFTAADKYNVIYVPQLKSNVSIYRGLLLFLQNDDCNMVIDQHEDQRYIP